MSRPVFGIDEAPIPGRSGASTVKRGASTFDRGFHMREDSAYPWIKTTGGPLPPIVTLTVPPSTATDLVLNPAPKSAALTVDTPDSMARQPGTSSSNTRKPERVRDMAGPSRLLDRYGSKVYRPHVTRRRFRRIDSPRRGTTYVSRLRRSRSRASS